MIEELIEKWLDVIEHSDDYTERTLAEEFIDDLKGIKRYVS